MPLWTTLSNFVDDTVIERSDLQPLLDNLLVLKNRNFDDSLNFALDTDQTTTSLTLVDVTITKYTINVDTEGGDLLVFVYVEARHSVAAGRIKFALKVDGEFHTPITSSSDDVLFTISNPAFPNLVPNLTFIVQNLAAGSHELSLAFGAGDAGTVTLNGDARRLHMVTVELH